QPALAVPADPRRVLELPQALEGLERPGAGSAVVAAEQPAVDPHAAGVREHLFKRGDVAVDVVEQPEHGLRGYLAAEPTKLSVPRRCVGRSRGQSPHDLLVGAAESASEAISRGTHKALDSEKVRWTVARAKPARPLG